MESVTNLAALKALTTRPDTVMMDGYYTPGDGGGGVFWWDAGSSATPNDSIVVQCTSGPAGRYMRIVESFLNARWFGATGDAVRNPSTGAWTGTDDTAALRNWEQTADTMGKARYLPAGHYIVTGLLTREDSFGFQLSSNVEIYGDGPSSVFVNKIVGTGTINAGIYRYTGVTEVDTSVGCYLAANAVAGDQTITVNNGALLSVGMFFYLIDHSVQIFDGTPDLVCCQGEVCRVLEIDGNTISLAGVLQFDYLAVPGAPITGTTLRLFTAPAENFLIRDIAIHFDATLAYTNTNACFFIRRALNVTYDNIHCIEPGMQACFIQDVIGYKFANTYIQCYDSIIVYTLRAGGCHFGQTINVTQYGGRHVIDGGASSVNGIEASYNHITGQAHFVSTAWQSHPGVRNWIFDSVIANNGNAIGSGTPGTTGVSPRGRFCSVLNPKVTGYTTGIYIVFGQDTVLRGGEIENCFDAIRVNRNEGAVISNVAIYNARNSAIRIDPSPNYQEALIFRDIDVYGNPTSVFNITGTIDPTWRIENIHAADATTGFTGSPTANMTLNMEAVTLSPTISGAVNDYGPSGIHVSSVLAINGGGADRNVTGLLSGSRGRTLTVRNSGTTNNLVLKNQDAGSVATNRFAFPGGSDITLAPLESVSLAYDTVSSRWLKG